MPENKYFDTTEERKKGQHDLLVHEVDNDYMHTDVPVFAQIKLETQRKILAELLNWLENEVKRVDDNISYEIDWQFSVMGYFRSEPKLLSNLNQMRPNFAGGWEADKDYTEEDIVEIEIEDMPHYYKCIQDHRSSGESKPAEGSEYENFWQEEDSYTILEAIHSLYKTSDDKTGAPEAIDSFEIDGAEDLDEWDEDKDSYSEGDKVTVGLRGYRCTQGHSPSEDNKPGSGSQWGSYWEPYPQVTLEKEKDGVHLIEDSIYLVDEDGMRWNKGGEYCFETEEDGEQVIIKFNMIMPYSLKFYIYEDIT